MSNRQWMTVVVSYSKHDCSLEWYGPYDYDRTCRKLATLLREHGNEQLSQEVADGGWIPDDDDDGFGYDDVGVRIEAQCIPGIARMKPIRGGAMS